ncbi:MAG: hypothetical protein M3Q99_04270 [Acidobacteriota bacterium]|nr:hypothetical protein [Acidobacteriota bacterium]
MLSTPQKTLTDAPLNFWLCFTFLFVAVLVFQGKPVPYSNEFVYLLRLTPNFLPNDWSFSQTANEHWLFNSLFSLPMRFFSLEIVGWTGRIAVWSLGLIALAKLGRRWEIPFWAIAAAIFLWLAFAQAVVNDEWIFGGFEAKTVAYVCLLFSLEEFSKSKIILPAILLGLSFSFHPAVGLWAIPAVGLALLFERIPTVDFVKLVGITALFSLFGLIPLFAEQTNATANSFEDWEFIILYRVPWHLDLFQFSKSGILLLYAMLVFNIAALWKSESFALRFLLKFQIALGAFFMIGFLLRWFELYPLLRLMPMRLFPILTPLFFIFTAFNFVPRLASLKQKIIVSLFVVAVVALLNPFGKGFNQIRETVRNQTAAPDDLRKTSRWIAVNTPFDAMIIQPPHSREIWYFSRRANIVSFGYPTFDRLSEWRERFADLTGNLRISKGEKAVEEIETAFNSLSAAQINDLKRKYAATHLVSRADYPFPVIFQTETYKVYQLP